MKTNTPTVIVTNEKVTLPDGVKRGRAYTEYKLAQLIEKLGQKQDEMKRAELVELVKMAGTSQMVEVTCKSGSVFTHVQPSALTQRFTGWNGHAWGSFHPSNVKSFRVVPACDITASETQCEDDTEFYYQ
jgi:hypothetical protein